jgi:prevent-host-death family protein
MTTEEPAVAASETIGAAEFKAHCLEILDRLSTRAVSRVTITKRGRPVAVLVPPDDEQDAVRKIHGFLRGTVVIPPDVDITAPVLDEAFDAAGGVLHR